MLLPLKELNECHREEAENVHIVRSPRQRQKVGSSPSASIWRLSDRPTIVQTVYVVHTTISDPQTLTRSNCNSQPRREGAPAGGIQASNYCR